jgi:flagellar M-ring protein FliF
MKAVSSAIGLNPARGDAISVESMPFNTELADRMKKEEQAFERDQQLALWLKIGAVVLLIGLIAYAVRLRNRKKQEEQELEMMAVAADEEAVAGEKSQDKEMSPQEKERLSQREFVEKMAKSKPDDVAQLIKAWLTDE